jgi:hypothetical protein
MQGMFLCGQDVSFPGLAGDMQAGGVAASSVLGFPSEDVFGGRNVLTALR